MAEVLKIKRLVEDEPDTNNRLWSNELSEDGNFIEEYPRNDKVNPTHLINALSKPDHKRVVFFRQRDDFGSNLYRFVGVFMLDVERTKKENHTIWKKCQITINFKTPTIMSVEYYRKKLIELRARVATEREAKKRDNEHYANLAKGASSPTSRVNYRKAKIAHAAAHDRHIEDLKREIERAREDLARERERAKKK